MKTILLFALLSAYPLAAIQEVTGKVEAVTVFTDRALVKRTFTLESTEKTGTVRFVKMPVSLFTDSVRASGVGVNVTGVALRYAPKVDGDEWASHPLKKKITALEKKVRAENDALVNFRDQVRVIDSMMRLTTNQGDNEARANQIHVDSWEKALDFLETKRSTYQAKIRKSDENLEALRKEIYRLTIQFNAETQVTKVATSEIEVSYSRTGEGKAKLELEYLVGNVTWTSLYDLRGSAEGSDFQLVSHAIIKQTTGENWPQVAVTLSTARPSTSISPGILRPWRVDASSLFDTPQAKSDSMNKGSAEAREEMATDVSTPSEVESGSDSTTVSITLPGRETILSDNSNHRVMLGTANLKATLSHVAVPSLSSFVYLKARIKNTSAAPVQGTMSAFLDGSFVGAVTLKTPAAVGEEFDVFLGADQRMQLKRTLLRGDVEKSGFFGGKVEVVNQWQIEVANFTKRTKEVFVYDQFPIPADPNIATKYIGASLSETTKDANGMLTWKLQLKSGEKTKFDFSYSLTFPKEIWKTVAQDNEVSVGSEIQSQYSPQQNAPSIRPQRQYNLEKMMRKK